MKLKEASVEDDASIAVHLTDRRPSFFQPHREATPTPRSSGSAAVDAPEKKLTLFAFRLALLEKSASSLGMLAFVWATVVLLGGFAVTLEPKDFVFVTIVLVIESTRIFSRSHELQWQHQSTGTLADAGRYSFRALQSSSRLFVRTLNAAAHPFSVFQREGRSGSSSSPDSGQDVERAAATASLANKHRRTWNTADVPLLPYAGWLFVAKNISRVLSLLQIASAFTCVALSLTRLIHQDYGEVSRESINRNKALNLFYSLALAEAIIFLLEKAYWEWKISGCSLLQTVCRECDLETSGIVAIKRFFYDTYSKCVDGSVFDGLKMDLVAFACELLDSEYRDEQVIGVQILQKLAHSDPLAQSTLRKIGTSTRVTERLIDMLNWKNPDEEEIRKCAAEIVSKLAGKRQSVLRVAGIPGAIDSISSLLHSSRSSNKLTPHELNEPSHGNSSNPDYDYSTFNLLGLRILKKLAMDQENCGKIGNARGLLPKIIDLTAAGRALLQNHWASFSQIKTVKRSLQVVKTLVSTTGSAGKLLRKEISENVFTVGNIREILQYGEGHMVLQMLGIEILKSLAMDEDAKEIIGRTGGIVKLLSSTFLNPRVVESEKFNVLPVEAGETLAMLALNCRNNCDRILKDQAVLDRLMGALEDVVLQINASRILRNLCAYSRPERAERLRGITAALPTVLKAVMGAKEKLLEASIGLTTQMCKLLMDTKPDKFSKVLEQANIEEVHLVEKLVQILKEYSSPDIKVPRIRRFVIEQTIWMMRRNRDSIHLFKRFEMERLLESVADTTLELECFHIFSGSVGLDRHNKTLSSVVDIALDLMND